MDVIGDGTRRPIIIDHDTIPVTLAIENIQRFIRYCISIRIALAVYMRELTSDYAIIQADPIHQLQRAVAEWPQCVRSACPNTQSLVNNR